MVLSFSPRLMETGEPSTRAWCVAVPHLDFEMKQDRKAREGIRVGKPTHVTFPLWYVLTHTAPAC